jgi:hypothetical protein
LARNLRDRYQKEGSETMLKSFGVDAGQLTSSARATTGKELAASSVHLDWNYYLGPFIRCIDYYVPELVPIFDVPDITFWVQQDVNGDGTLETIYSEGYFDARWDSAPIPDVTLHASAIAVASPMAADDPTCGGPEVPCAEPAIVLAGMMPVQNLPAPADPYLDQTAGYAQRPNRPHPHGLVGEAPPPHSHATAPFCGTLNLFGCNHYEGASFYRLIYTFRAPGSATTTAPVPFQNLTWQLWRWVGSPGHLELLPVGPDVNGWYQILNDADGWMPGQLLLSWPTGDAGLYTITMQFADGGKNYLAGSDTSPVGIYVDNTSPSALISELRWRVSGGAWSAPLPRLCAVIMRPRGSDIEFRVSYTASALHLRDLALSGSGCGGGNPIPESFPNWSDPPTLEFDGSGVSLNPYSHWHTDPNDNSISRTAIFALSAAAPQGAYDFSLGVNSRTFNPAGGDGGFGADWNYNIVYKWTPDYWKLAIIDV